MKISFVETETSEHQYFLDALEAHEIEFARHLEEVSAESEAVCVFIYSNVDKAFLETHPAMRLVVTRSTSVEHIDTDECARRGITVRSVRSYGEFTVAEHTFALLLALSRRLRDVMSGGRRGFSYEDLRAFELREKTLGLIGIGRIGQQVIPIARAFGMEVVVHDPQVHRSLAEALGVRAVALDDLLRTADIISLHAALTSETHHLINRATLAKCRRGVIIINTARGPLIDTGALAEALDSGHVGGAGLDVLEDERVLRRPAPQIMAQQIVDRLHSDFPAPEPRDPRRIGQLSELMRTEKLLARPNVVFTPHIAFNSVEAIERINRATVESIRTFAAHSTGA